uniref:Uncharacterized protein n=1 Tax=Meloidogyne incognita TaxID=6306 RepID=A0A914NQN0_MELIC
MRNFSRQKMRKMRKMRNAKCEMSPALICILFIILHQKIVAIKFNIKEAKSFL